MTREQITKLARDVANEAIDKCKQKAYGGPCGNVLEGDYGTWNDWRDVIADAVYTAVAGIIIDARGIT